MPHSIKIENITDSDYQRLQSEAAAARLSLRNYARQALGIALAPGPGNPTGNARKPIKQPKGKKRGVRRSKAEIQQIKEQSE